MKKYLITGGAGFIGSNLVKYMLDTYDDILIVNLDLLTYAGNLESLSEIEADSRYIFIKGDICDKDLVTSLFEKYSFDAVINLAAESHVDRSIHNPEVFGETNFMGTLNMLNCAKEAWYDGTSWQENKKYVQVSTDEVYGSLGPTGLFTESTPINPHSPYSASKAAADLMVLAYFDTYKMPANVTRCSNNYGPYQFPEKLIPLMINNARNAKSLPVYGDGLNIRDWLYVSDHCSAIDLVANKGKIGEVYNIGGNNERTNIYIVKLIISVLKDMGVNADESLIKFVEDRKGHDRRYGIDSDKISRELGWCPEITFEEGLPMTIKWNIDNSKWIDNIISGDYMKFYQLNYKE